MNGQQAVDVTPPFAVQCPIVVVQSSGAGQLVLWRQRTETMEGTGVETHIGGS